MIKFIILLLASTFSTLSYSACTLQDNTFIDKCQQDVTDANVLIEWDKPTHYITGELQNTLGGTKLIVQNLGSGNFLGTKTVTDPSHEAMYLKLSEGSYRVLIWAYTTAAVEGPAVDFSFEIKLVVVPSHPTNFTESL